MKKQCSKCKEKDIGYQQKWREDNREFLNNWYKEYFSDEARKEKKNVRNTLNNALNRGEVKKGVCEVCQEEKVEAHHPDYNKPLDVKWLCKIHHGELRWIKTNLLITK